MPDDRPPWRCETCKHWDRPEMRPDGWPRYKVSRGDHDLSIPRGWNVCALICGDSLDLPDLARATSGEWWPGLFFTSPDFGCNQWEANDAD
jgi:hypothetical protein